MIISNTSWTASYLGFHAMHLPEYSFWGPREGLGEERLTSDCC